MPADILKFYLWGSPYAKSDKPCSACSINLADRGFAGSELTRLTMWLYMKFSEGDGEGLLYTASRDINDYVKNIQALTGHQKAVLQINATIKVLSNNRCSLSVDETYATCFFRHVRNSLAHACFTVAGDRVLFMDQSSKMATAQKNVSFTAWIETSFSLLYELMDLIKGGNPSLLPSVEELSANKNSRGYMLNLTKVDISDAKEGVNRKG